MNEADLVFISSELAGPSGLATDLLDFQPTQLLRQGQGTKQK